jgi:hypothetical protein
MKFLDDYFISRIDYALDQAQPLDTWTAWYVKRKPKLMEYYTAMLKIELELRFPEIELPDKDQNETEKTIVSEQAYCNKTISKAAEQNTANATSQNVSSETKLAAVPVTLSQNCCPEIYKIPKQNRRQIYSYKKIFLSATTIIIFAVAAVVFLNHHQQPDTTTPISTIPTTNPTNKQKIDLAVIFDEPFFDAIPLSTFSQTTENSFEDSVLEFMVEPVINFTDAPLEKTLTFLETTGIIRSSIHKQPQKL